MSKRVYADPDIYTRYYVTQAGHGLEAFHGDEYMYGAGFAGLFRGLFRRAVPLIRRGLELVKPHVKNAARGIAKDALTSVSSAVMDRITRSEHDQKGSGVVYINRKPCKGKRRYDTAFPPPPHSNKKTKRKKNRGQKTTRRSPGDIF